MVRLNFFPHTQLYREEFGRYFNFAVAGVYIIIPYPHKYKKNKQAEKKKKPFTGQD